MKKISALFLISLAFFLNACSKEEEIQNDFMFEEYHKGDKIVLNSVNGGSKT
ncbi:TlpA family protein disulfide reductase, partial [Campylobacter jejuni]|nr:TlpA family protein disulfide reductase [Campylobacter jejuni]